MDSNDDKYFPLVYDEYYYYCRISIVEEAKERYMQCNHLLLGTGINDSPVMKLLEGEIDKKKQNIYSKYKKLYNDFISYSDKLINKESIESQDDYIRCMQNLMRISNEMVIFTYENFGVRKNKMLSQKVEYNGKKVRLSNIIEQNRNISCILNSDEITTVVTDKYYNVFLFIMMVVMFPIGLTILPRTADFSVLITYNIVMKRVLSIIFVIGGLIFLGIRIKYRKKIHLIELKGNVQSKNRYLVVHPYTSKFSLKNIKGIVSIIHDLTK